MRNLYLLLTEKKDLILFQSQMAVTTKLSDDSFQALARAVKPMCPAAISTSEPSLYKWLGDHHDHSLVRIYDPGYNFSVRHGGRYYGRCYIPESIILQAFGFEVFRLYIIAKPKGAETVIKEMEPVSEALNRAFEDWAGR